ncbi:MAG: hypothetical protein WA979_09180 [Pacificimonas sp.]
MKMFRIILLFMATLGLAMALFFGISRHQDQSLFRDTITANITAPMGTGAFVEELNSWVYSKEGFAQCKARYVWDPLGATPMQIYEAGGDCSDKSRLLSAMLDSVDMDSTLVMLQPCRTCAATHTIVNAEAGGDIVAADPVYDMVWPDPAGGYYGVAEIRDDNDILMERLEALKRERPVPDKINFHSPDEMKYGFPKTVNWDRDGLFQLIGGAVARLTDEPYLIDRPRIFEDPKLFLMWAGLGLASFSGILLILFRRRFH